MSTKKLRKAEAEKSKILVVDDHPMIRQGLASLIDDQPDLVTCGQAEDAPEALKAISETKPDIVVLDISLKSSSGIELMKSIKAQYPKLPVLILSMHDEDLYAERALRAGHAQLERLEVRYSLYACLQSPFAVRCRIRHCRFFSQIVNNNL